MDQRRRDPRFPPRGTVVSLVVSAWPERSQAAVVADLSAGGLRLLTAQSVEPDGLVLLDVPGVGHFAARVRHAAQRSDGLWVGGCELLAALSPDEVVALRS